MQLFNYITPSGVRGVGFHLASEDLDLARALMRYAAHGGGGLIPGTGHIESTDALLACGWITSTEPAKLDAWLRRQVGGDEEDLRLPDGWAFAPPMLRPGKILAIARNYAKHAAELGNAAPEKLAFFEKFPSTMVPSSGEIRLPAWLEGRTDHEAELAVIIGTRARNVSAQDALSHVAGYTIVNDISSRGLQEEAKEKRMPWTAAKNLDTFCPIGPYFVTPDSVKDVQSLRVQCRVNGQTRQDGNTRDMIYPVAKTIAELSRYCTLEPCDIISTGTPEGVGKLSHADRVECEVEGLGVLVNTVVDEKISLR